jgi:asparagine synthetase B (glutamine-hydrolysing)
MCGLFGIARKDSNLTNVDAMRRGAILVRALGVNSEERGVHSSGLAMVTSSIPFQNRAITKETANSKESSFNNTYIYKDSVKFSKLEMPQLGSERILTSNIVLGHSRYATQGAASSLKNASPMLAGNLVGTHNGDVSKASIELTKEDKKLAIGETDTEQLFIALSLASGSRKEMTAVLRKAIGRIALAFVDRKNPERLYLVRGALSPISYAWTNDGDFVYASNPDWFRRIQKETKGDISFSNITLVPEGRLISVNTITGEVEDVRKFTPSCRDSDLYIIRSGVYKKFNTSDRDAFETLSRRKIYATTIKKEWAEPLVVEGYVEEPISSADLWQDPSLPPPLFEFETDIVEDWELDLDSIEKLCYAMDDFDEKAYTKIIGAETEEDGLRLYTRLYRDMAKMYEKGLTRKGFRIDDVFNPF